MLMPVMDLRAVVDAPPTRLIRQSDLAYAGAFRLPASNGQYPNGFDYGGTGLVYVPSHNSLMVGGTTTWGYVAEVSIPTPVKAASVANLPRATLKQTFTDVLDGKRFLVDGDKSNGAYIGGLLPVGTDLLVSVFDYYDGTQNQSKTHFRTSLNFAGVTGKVTGPYVVGNGQGGFVSGYMTPIPTEWQTAFKGSALTGNCCLSVINRTSFGPSVTVFNPEDVGRVNPVPANRVLGYPFNHPTIGGYAPPGELFNGACTMGGVCFPAGTSSVLFFGRKPTSKQNYCYGQGTNDQSLHGKPNPAAGPNEVWCYDPSDSTKGTHGYPYTFHVWAYDAHDLTAGKQPWEPVPYATWAFDLPYGVDWGYAGKRNIKGVAYDPNTQRIFLTVEGQDGGWTPLVHVFQVAA